jgi:FolB domain-containing protein
MARDDSRPPIDNYAYHDRIELRDLVLRCIVGVNPDERERKQDVMINIKVYADLRVPGETDSIDDTINYRTIKRDVMDLIEQSSFFLVERMAQAVADTCLAYDGVEAVSVRVEKPGALRFVQSVGVEIFRERSRRRTT